jgi:hypothetical protein
MLGAEGWQGRGCDIAAHIGRHLDPCSSCRAGVCCRIRPRSCGQSQIADAIDTEDDRLAVQYELLLPDLPCRLVDPRITVSPVVATSRDQAHTITIAFQPQPVAVVFHFAEAVGSIGDDGCFCGKSLALRCVYHARQQHSRSVKKQCQRQ